MSAQATHIADRVTLGLRRHLLRQVNHWEGAAERLDDFEATASPAAWASLERYVGVALRGGLKDARDQLKREALAVRATFKAVRSRSDLERVSDLVARLRKRYLQTELLVDFYVDAVRARANPEVSVQLRACDVMAERAVSGVLERLGLKAPPIMTYFKPGIGASILRIGTKLWDGSLSRIAAVKLTWQNRFRPTALLHECGHQVAGIIGWNDEFAQVIRTQLADAGDMITQDLASWASEIAADSFAFAYTGYASVVALSDVVAGPGADVFRYLPGDPHPIAYLRVLLGVEMCRRFYGMGPWEELAAAWQDLYPITDAPVLAGGLVTAILPLLPRIVEIALLTPLRCFHDQRLADLVDPQRVAPTALAEMQRKAGALFFSSSHWIWNECVRWTALSGLRYATEPEAGPQILKQQEDLMIKLGKMTQLAA